ncbi:4Fe-4S binding protein [Pseudobacteroides cellulosolvens]|uniref:Cobyrinic acid ac-diamide synthase n=1 Tax=Pseudobacteroides cellulosolvens ATCC 35603 = DSM 2933 TaxID=398512 RepID=A0A0L6JKR6_9FIRM|nr:ATP-binding protein [Pseudobacteroides cellulosolvens]KNY25972.1 Cobyrinic acid ac-diamide synthase [Pseudobacteroides cellulosolvens ATCC 35603 = DSM 2933]
MKQLVILSGKGGTGKTTVAASFIALASNKAYSDCDVDAPNLQLIYASGSESEIADFYGYQKAVKYDKYCTNCGKCEELCQFGAIKDGKLNAFECEGCGVCEAFCSSTDEYGKKAIRLENNISGQTMVYKIEGDVFSTAELKMGNGASGKLVTQVRKNLYNSMNGQEIVIIDGSPGIGCPVIASMTGVDMVLVVTEPTLSGMHDMERIIETAGKFDAACVVCINKFDVNLENTQKIEEYCTLRGIPVAGRIPFDPRVIEAVNAGKPITLISCSPAKDAVIQIWESVSSILLNKN